VTVRDDEWPSPRPDNEDDAKALYQAKLNLHQKRVDAEIAREAAATAAQNAQQVAAIAAAATTAATAADTKQRDDDFAHGAAERAAELASNAAYEQALLDVAKAPSIEHGQTPTSFRRPPRRSSPSTPEPLPLPSRSATIRFRSGA
jgi:hypothetical protein